jgi:hydrogenase maturation factor HypF (carbamoyltransferase family)
MCNMAVRKRIEVSGFRPHVCKRLMENRLTVITQSRVPLDDGGLALGQAVIGAHVMKKYGSEISAAL